MNQQPPIPIRMSSAGYCPRRQAYAALGEPPSSLPTRQDENRMALGDAAEDILVNNMLRDGWEITDTRSVPGGEQLELEIDFPLPMTGHPDGICRHPEHTRNLWVTLECKSMFEDRLFRVKHEGIAQVYPEYLAQAMTYSRILYESGRVAHPHRAVFAIMDRDGEQLPPERVAWDTPTETSSGGTSPPPGAASREANSQSALTCPTTTTAVTAPSSRHATTRIHPTGATRTTSRNPHCSTRPSSGSRPTGSAKRRPSSYARSPSTTSPALSQDP